MIKGGCLCGAVRYECLAEPAAAANCYCRDCQRAGGGAMASVILFPKADFKLTKGEPKQYEVTADSGRKVSRWFCANCGSPIMSVLATSPMVAIKAGSLDDPNLFEARANVYVSSAPRWAHIAADLPKFDKMPS